MVLPAPPEISPARRKLLMSKRQTLIMELGALEDYLLLERSIKPKWKRKLLTGVTKGAENYIVRAEVKKDED